MPRLPQYDVKIENGAYVPVYLGEKEVTQQEYDQAQWMIKAAVGFNPVAIASLVEKGVLDHA